MDIQYDIYNPSGNITALVKTSVDPGHRKTVADGIMAKHREVEQVGFLGEGTLTMTGGEFCGNASACGAAALWGENGDGIKRVSLAVSGCKEKVDILLHPIQNGSRAVEVCMPLPLSVRKIALPTDENVAVDATVVFMPGISHCIVKNTLTRETAQTVIREWCRLLSAQGLGIMLLSEDETEMTPLVYVPGADTLFWESSCASGSTAVGWYRYENTKKQAGFRMPFCAEIRQPGGSINICIREQNGQEALWLTTNVTKEESNTIPCEI